MYNILSLCFRACETYIWFPLEPLNNVDDYTFKWMTFPCYQRNRDTCWLGLGHCNVCCNGFLFRNHNPVNTESCSVGELRHGRTVFHPEVTAVQTLKDALLRSWHPRRNVVQEVKAYCTLYTVYIYAGSKTCDYKNHVFHQSSSRLNLSEYFIYSLTYYTCHF